MTVKKTYGDEIAVPDLDKRAVPTLPSSRVVAPPIQVNRWVRNVNKHPNAMLENLKDEALNQAAVFRTKDYCHLFGAPGAPGVLASSAQDRWRFAFRAGPYAHTSIAHLVMRTPDPSYVNQNGYVQLDLYSDPTESTLVSSTQFNYGTGAQTISSPKTWRPFYEYVDVTPNTDYYAVVRNMNGGRVLSLLMFELGSLTQHGGGYLPQNVSVQNPITDAYREGQSAQLQALWEGYGSSVFTWTTDPGNTWSTGWGPAPLFDYKTRTSATPSNVLDYSYPSGGSTVVSANTPGWQPDLRYCKRRSQAGVPCVMKAFGKAGAGSSSGNVYLKDSTGAVVASITGGWSPTAGYWQSAAFNMRATYEKYDLHFSGDGANAFGLWAVSIYPVG